MKIEHVTAPSYRELRPFKEPTSDGFPVYPDLAERLATTDAHPDDDLRFVMAVCAAYAYGDASTLAMMMTRLGLERNRGFYRNVRSTRHQIMDALERALGGYSVESDGAKLERELEALYITGHSLGGASAQMLAAMLFADPAYAPLRPKLKAVYTYGAPMIGTPEFAAACDGVEFLGRNLIRYVYEDDIVPQVPPTEAGPFAHFGREYRFRASRGGWESSTTACGQIRSLFAMLATPASLMTRQLKATRRMRFKASLSDHFPQYYIDALTPDRVRSEFGN